MRYPTLVCCQNASVQKTLGLVYITSPPHYHAASHRTCVTYAVLFALHGHTRAPQRVTYGPQTTVSAPPGHADVGKWRWGDHYDRQPASTCDKCPPHHSCIPPSVVSSRRRHIAGTHRGQLTARKRRAAPAKCIIRSDGATAGALKPLVEYDDSNNASTVFAAT